MRSKERLVALLTDFGSIDPWVAAMKGVIHEVCPGAAIVDVGHAIPRHDVEAAAFTLLSVVKYFPEKTVFVCVVDPGVGTGRRILLLEQEKRLFLAPDNGLLNFISRGAAGERWYRLNVPQRPGAVSRTFHGRDIFAPAGARLAKGMSPVVIATRIPALTARELFTDPPGSRQSSAAGKILHIDHFGNIVTNIRMPQSPGETLSLRIGRRTIRRTSPTYEEAPGGVPFLIGGSIGLLEVSIKREDAARALGARRGDRVVLRRLPK